jgi:hypothetical protein
VLWISSAEKQKPRRQASWHLFIQDRVTPLGAARLFLLRGLLGLLGRGFLLGWHVRITFLSVGGWIVSYQ